MALLTLALLAFSSADASAALQRPFERGFAVSPGTTPMSVAFDSAGDLYVLEGVGANSAIEKVDTLGNPVPFSASQDYIDGNKLTGTPSAAFNFETFLTPTIAVDHSGGPTDGYIYVAQSSPSGLNVFDDTGTYRGLIPGGEGPICGVAVNQSNGDLYTGEYYSGQVRWFVPSDGDPANNVLHSTLQPVGNFACQIAVDAAGDLYASGYPYWGVATKYAASQFGQETAVGTVLEAKQASQFAIDPNNSDVYANIGTRIDRFDSSGAQVLPSIADEDLVSSAGLALASDGRLYASETSGQISVYGPTELDLPLLTTGGSSSVVQNSASLAGNVDPDSAGDVSGCEFKYGVDKSYSSGSVPCVPAASSEAPITAPTPVTADLSGLAPDTTYHYRLFATNENGTGTGHDATFKTPLAIEGMTTGAATAVDKDSAVLGGSYTGDGQDVHYYFEYGTSMEYGETEPTPPGADAGTGSGSQTVAPIEISGLQGATVYHYRLVASNSFGSAYGTDKTFTTEPAVTNLTADAPTGITNETAELRGSFTADSYDTHYYFEYGQTDSYGSSAPAPPGNDAGTGSGPLSVEPVTVGGLQQGANYHFRIVASNSRGTTYSADRTFRTAEAPSINSFSSDNVRVTSADLHATINPHSGDTTYHFEYGPTIDYGTSVPVPDQPIGSGLLDEKVSVHLDGLASGVTYHFQVVAQNQYGRTVSGDQTFGFYPPPCPNAQVRQETNSDHVPDCRAYEIASAGFAGGTTLFPSAGPNSGQASHPARLAYGGGFGAIPGAGDPVNAMGDLYVATRTDAGWTTRYIGLGGNRTQEMGGPPEAGMLELLYQSPDSTQIGVQTTPDMNRILSYDDGYPVYGKKTGSNAPYVWDSGTNDLLDRWPSNLDQVEGGEDFTGTPKVSADFSHFVFSSEVVFAEGGEATVPPSGSPPAQPGDMRKRAWAASVYDNNTVSGEVELASVRSDDSGYIGVPVAVSADGTRILISEGSESLFAEPAPLMLRVDGETTYELAEAHPVKFVSTTADGRTVYFTSVDPLTEDDDDTSVDLFRWDEDSPQSLTRVSFGRTGDAGNSDDCSVGWSTKCGVGIIAFAEYSTIKGGLGGNGESDNFTASESGDIYFESPEQLDGAKGEFGQVNLYLYRGGEVRFVATMSAAPLCTISAGSPTCSEGPVARMQVTPNGAHAAFVTPSRVTSYDNNGKGQMYTYDPATRRLVCVSCKPSGEPPTADVYASQNGLFLTDDGRAFFSTDDSIVRQDTNGVIDVYEFSGGRPQLLTTGIGQGPGEKFTGFTGLYTLPGLVSVSADGTDAYFATMDQLVTQDHNGEQVKIYDARTNGGFPSDLPPANCEAADECHGAGSNPPAPLIEGTVPNLGRSGNVVSKSRKARKKHRKRNKHKRQARKRAQKKGKQSRRGRSRSRAKRGNRKPTRHDGNRSRSKRQVKP